MNKDLQEILKAMRKRGGSESGINFDISEEGAMRLRGADGKTPEKGVDYWTPEEVNEMVTTIFEAAKLKKGVDYYTEEDKRAFLEEIFTRARPILGKDGKDGIDGRDGKDGKDGKNGKSPDPKDVALVAIKYLETFEGDARISAKALRDLDESVTEILKKGADFTFTENQVKTIKDLLPKYPPMNAGGSGATFLKSLRDVDLSGLTKNADGKYVLGGGSGTSDHGALTGLADDDHTQYHNDTRGDARYSLLGHNHTGTYAPTLGADDNYVTDAEKTAIGTIGNKLNTADIDDTPVNGETSAPISSNWAFDHEADTSTHGVTTVAGISETQTLTNKRVNPRTASSTTSATLTPDLSSANVYFRTTQTEALTIGAPTGTPVIGETILIYVDSAGAQTLTMNATYKVFGAAFPATTTAGKTLMISSQFNGTDWKTLWANLV